MLPMSTNSILDGYVREPDFALDNNISPRTSARYRQLGMPFTKWGGEIYIHIAGARDWLISRTKRQGVSRTRHHK
jgi:hypothetical protein